MERFMERRRNYYIKKRFQRNFIIKFCVLVAAGSLISGIIIYTMSMSTLTTTFENSRLTIKSTGDYILPAVLLSSAVVIFVIGLATIIVTLFTSHKIAGPLYRMEKDIEEIIKGNLKIRFNLRRTDEIKALATALDVMAQTLKTNVKDVKDAVLRLESEIERLGKEELKDKLQDLKTALNKFNT